MRGIIASLMVLGLAGVASGAPAARVRIDNVRARLVAALAHKDTARRELDVVAFATHERTRGQLVIRVEVRVVVSDATGRMLAIATASSTASGAIRSTNPTILRDQAITAAIKAVADRLRVRRSVTSA